MSDLQELKPAIAAFAPAQSQLLSCRVGSPSSSASHKKTFQSTTIFQFTAGPTQRRTSRRT